MYYGCEICKKNYDKVEDAEKCIASCKAKISEKENFIKNRETARDELQREIDRVNVLKDEFTKKYSLKSACSFNGKYYLNDEECSKENFDKYLSLFWLGGF